MVQLYVSVFGYAQCTGAVKLVAKAGAGEAGGQGGPCPPNKIFNDAFFL